MFHLTIVTDFIYIDFQFNSQHPYLEKYVGKPNVYTIDYSNKTQLRVTLQEIVNNFKLKKVAVYLPIFLLLSKASGGLRGNRICYCDKQLYNAFLETICC